MEDDTPAPLFLTESELSKRWGIPKKTFQRWRWQGGGPPFVKFGGNVRYAMSDITNYEKLNRFFSTSEKSPKPDDGLEDG